MTPSPVPDVMLRRVSLSGLPNPCRGGSPGGRPLESPGIMVAAPYRPTIGRQAPPDCIGPAAASHASIRAQAVLPIAHRPSQDRHLYLEDGLKSTP